MNLNQIDTKNFIMALFKRDDGERFLLGTGLYEFKDGLQHFQPNIIANDVVEKQGANGQLLAGQVARSASQPFVGFIGDNTTTRSQTEIARRQFFRFFQPNYFYTVIYILPTGEAIQRKNGYLTEAPSVPEMIERFPEYRVALAFEDLNYYTYDEDNAGNEIYAQVYQLEPESQLTGGLVWESTPGLTLIRVGGDLSQTGTPTPTDRKAISVATGIQTITIDGVNYKLDISAIWLAKLNASQDYIWNDNGTWKIHKEIYRNTYYGTESWSKNNNRTWRSSFDANGIIDATIAGAAVCDRFVYWPNQGAIGQNLPVDQFGFPATRTNIDFNCGDCPAATKSTDEWKAWLAAHPVRIYSIRLSATETIITDATLLAQLNAIDAALKATTTAPTATTTSTDAIPPFLGTSAITADDGIVWTAETAGGRNLYNYKTAGFLNGYVNAAGTSVSSTTRTTYIPCEPNTTYTVRKTNAGTNQRFCVFDTATKPAIGVQCISSVGTRAGLDTASNYTITTGAAAAWLCVFFKTPTTTPSEDDIIKTIQIEKGSTVHAYEPYIPAGGAVWDAETGHATTTMTVGGLFPVNPIWIVPGPAESPLIENLTDNTSLSYLGTIAAGQSLVVDCGAQTATLAGANVKNNIRGTWQKFEPGQVTIRYSGANITGPSTIQWNEVVE